MSDESTAAPEAPRFAFTYETSVPAILDRLGITLACTTYQAGKVILLRASGDRVSALLRTFDWATGLAARGRSLALGTKNQIWTLRNERDIAASIEPAGRYDACFVPRSSHVTGDIRVHDLGWAEPSSSGDEPELWLVNTRFSCLCTLDPNHSFVPRWKPPFITSLEPEDRCHLNGLAIRDGGPRYVTVLGETDAAQGWRENKASGGAIIDIADGKLIRKGLAMPHSPRWHNGRLYYLNSGCGDLESLDPATGKSERVARLPGYTRGLALRGNLAFVGLSKVREKREFGGLPVEKLGESIRCGIWIVDIADGATLGAIEFSSGVEELFAVEVLDGVRFPALIGLEKDTINGVYILPNSARLANHGIGDLNALHAEARRHAQNIARDPLLP